MVYLEKEKIFNYLDNLINNNERVNILVQLLYLVKYSNSLEQFIDYLDKKIENNEVVISSCIDNINQARINIDILPIIYNLMRKESLDSVVNYLKLEKKVHTSNDQLMNFFKEFLIGYNSFLLYGFSKIDFINFLVKYKKDSKVYDVIMHNRDSTFKSLEFAQIYSNVHQINIKSLLEIEFFKERPFDLLFANLIFDLKLPLKSRDYLDDVVKKENKKNDNIAEWTHINFLVKLLNYTKKLFLLVKPSVLFSLSANLERKSLIENGLIEMIVDLPQKMVFGANHSVCLMILSKNNKKVKFIDALDAFEDDNNNYFLDYKEVLRRIKSDTSLHNIEVKKRDLIDSKNILLPRTQILKANINVKSPIKLKEVTLDIFRGIQLSKKEKEETAYQAFKLDSYNYRLLSLSSFDTFVNESKLQKILIQDDSKLKRYLLKPFDIIMTSRGTQIKIALAQFNIYDNIVATGNVVIIRPNLEHIDYQYLYMFLNSDLGQKTIDSIKKGTVLQSINPNDLKNIEIPNLSKEQQNRIGYEYMHAIYNLHDTKLKIKNHEENLNRIQKKLSDLYF